MSGLLRQLINPSKCAPIIFRGYSGKPGDGAGKGGGGGGSIRDAGGSFGRREAALEDEYFYRQQKEQLAKLKDSLHTEIAFHEEQIKRHQEAIERNKKRISDMQKAPSK